MIGRRAIVGLSLLSALLFCALMAQGAVAAAHTSENTTAFTCVKGGGNLDFADEHCDETVVPGTGKFGHVLIPSGTTEIEVTNAKTANQTTAAEPTTIKTKVAGAETHIVCNTVSGKGWIENAGTLTEHKVTGTLTVEDTNCTVLKPANCKVKEPIRTTTTFMGVDQLGPEKNTMGLEFVPDPEGVFSEINYEGEKCALKGKTFKVEGWKIATPGPTGGGPSPSAKESGATLKFEPGNEMQKLTTAGNPVELSSILTMRMAGEGNPITFTTPT